MKDKIITAPDHGFTVGDTITYTGFWEPWYKRWWHYFFPKKPLVCTITAVDSRHSFICESEEDQK